MIRVEVRLYAGLDRARPDQPSGAPLHIKLEAGATVRAVARAIDLPEARIHLAFVNGTARGLDRPLENGDRIGLFPPVGGG